MQNKMGKKITSFETLLSLKSVYIEGWKKPTSVALLRIMQVNAVEKLLLEGRVRMYGIEPEVEGVGQFVVYNQSENATHE